MKLCRSRAELWVGLALLLLLAALIFVMVVAVVERCERNVGQEPGFAQVDFEPGHYKVMKEKK